VSDEALTSTAPSGVTAAAAEGAGSAAPSGARPGIPFETRLFLPLALLTALAFLLADPEPPLVVQIAAIAILAAVLGMPHGALDPLIARRLGLWRTSLTFAAFNLGYTAVAAAVVGLWLLAPVPSLVAFLLISAAHFGSDWNRERPLALRFLTGAALLSLPSLRDQDAVADLYVTLAGDGAGAVAAAQAALGPLLLVGLAVAAVIAARRAPHEAFELLGAAALALLAPPLMFFIVYFCALHSARHLREGFREENGHGWSLTLLVVAAYTLAPLALAAAFLVGTAGTAALDEQLLRVVFIGLAALTVPHMALVTLGDRALRRTAATVGGSAEPVLVHR
jgi:Brp/Blh family beta-carotene 15,15'-monooxygenase